MAIRSNSNVERVRVRDAELRQFPHEVHNALAQQWLSPRQAELGDAHAYKNSSHSQVVREWKLAIDCPFVPSAAVHTSVVAAVRDGDPQVGDGAPEFVLQRSHCHYSSVIRPRRRKVVDEKWPPTTDEFWKGDENEQEDSGGLVSFPMRVSAGGERRFHRHPRDECRGHSPTNSIPRHRSLRVCPWAAAVGN